MRLGLGRLALPPETFWAMSPAELTAAAEGRGVVAVVERPALEALMAAFPDEDRR
jgi:uncharacterized phage protein (TIGR02216 family)